jgi:hypothetical protein
MMQRKRSIIFDLVVHILVPLLERRHYQEATVASRMHLDKSVDQCIRLLYQPNAQYQIHVNCKGITSVYFGKNMPSSGSTVC